MTNQTRTTAEMIEIIENARELGEDANAITIRLRAAVLAEWITRDEAEAIAADQCTTLDEPSDDDLTEMIDELISSIISEMGDLTRLEILAVVNEYAPEIRAAHPTQILTTIDQMATDGDQATEAGSAAPRTEANHETWAIAFTIDVAVEGDGCEQFNQLEARAEAIRSQIADLVGELGEVTEAIAFDGVPATM